MKLHPLLLALAPMSLAAAALSAVQDETFAPPAATAEHRWLQQLVGEWDVKLEARMAPGAEPMQWESRESMRALGDLWVVGEGTAQFGDTAMHSILTIGYDPRDEVFRGTWIDTVQTHLWTYTGQLDEERRVLNLDAEGPSMEDPSQNARYRDAIEIVGPDHKRMVSSLLEDDGTWTEIMRADYHRRAKSNGGE